MHPFVTQADSAERHKRFRASRIREHAFVRAAKWGDSWQDQPRNERGEFGSGGGTAVAEQPTPAGTPAEGYASKEEFAQAVKQAQDKVASAPRPSEEQRQANLVAMATSSRRGGDFRGNSRDRQARAGKLLAEFGDGTHCPCVYCGKTLDKSTITQDKIFTGHQGGRYQMSNLLPACGPCNNARGDKPLVAA